jgi:hypothetical protein
MWENVKKKNLFIFFCVVLLCFLCSEFRVVLRLNLQLFIEKIMSYLRYLCFFAYSDVQHILCSVFPLFFFVLCTLCCRVVFLFTSSCVPYVAVLCFYLLRLVYPMLPCCVCIYFVLLTLCCQFSGFSIFDCPYLSIRSKDDVLFRVLIKYMNKELELKKYRTYKILRH